LVGSLFNEPMRVETVRASGDATWILGLVGTQSERFRKVTLSSHDFENLTVLDSGFTYDGDASLLRLGLQAYSLGIAWEFDPYFGLSISRVDPLPHQLEAVYDYLLKLARARFLLADDAGAGKTIMAGLLIRELQLRGLAERIIIICPANLAFQWQRELKEKFDEKFLVMKGGDIRDQFGVNQWLEQKKVITSLDLAKRTEILPGLRQVHWDLIIVDEAHRMSWTPPDIPDPEELEELEEAEREHLEELLEAITLAGNAEQVHEEIAELRQLAKQAQSVEDAGTILLTPNERRVAEDRRDCYWLCVVTDCAGKPVMQEPIKDPARFSWREVTKVAHYWMEVDSMTKPMMLRQDDSPYEGQRT